MKVLHVVPSFFPAVRYGGPIESTLRLCQALIAAGVEVEVATTDCDGPNDLPVRTDGWVDVEGVRVRYFHRWPRVDFAASAPLARFLAGAAHTYELVHVTSAFSFPSAAAAWACRRSAVPFVVTPRGSLRPAALGSKQWKKAPYWLGVDRPNLRRAAALHATSREEADDLWRLGLRRPTYVIPNGVAAVPTQQVERRRGLVVFLGRLHPVKGLDGLVRALSLAATKEPRLEAIIAGPDQDGEQARLQALVDRLHPRPVVRFPGPVFGPEKYRLLASAELVVLPSHTENFGMVVVEALACGTPVIASRHTPWKILEDAGAGRWVDNSPESLAGAICDVLGDAAVAGRMAEAAPRLAARFQWNTVGQGMARLYQAIVRGETSTGIHEG